MAIKPENRKLYGKDWPQFSRALCAKIGRCEICGKAKPDIPHLTVHHKDRDPTNRDRSNLLVCCPRHHFQQEQLINSGHQHPRQVALFTGKE